MTATNDILQFAGSATGADILTQVAYAADTDRPIGHQIGIARRDLENKALLQASTISAAVAQYMANSQANNIADSVSVATLAGYLKTAIKNVAIMFTDAAGTADALTAAFTPASTALADGDFMVIRAASANATSTPTLAVDGLTAKTIVKGSNAALAAGDIAGAGYYLLVSYDATLGKYVLHNPANAASSGSLGYLHVRQELSSGTDGGTFTAGSPVGRLLNTTVTNTITGASLVGTAIISLPAGTFKIFATAPAHNVNRHQASLIRSIGSVLIIAGTTENTTGVGSTSEEPTTTRSIIQGIFTLASPAYVGISHECSKTQSTSGLGSAAGFSNNEVYTEAFIEQIA